MCSDQGQAATACMSVLAVLRAACIGFSESTCVPGTSSFPLPLDLDTQESCYARVAANDQAYLAPSSCEFVFSSYLCSYMQSSHYMQGSWSILCLEE